MITRISVYIRRFKRWLNRSYWAIRLFHLSKSSGTEATPGLVMIQIDGLSQKQFRRALKEGNMPFLKRLLEQEQYIEHAHYSGVPSTTPAVQGELFYGVKGCVPAFNFMERKTNQTFIMFDPKSAEEIEGRLARENVPLLEGGSSYSNIFCGGAAEAHFCAAAFGLKGFFKVLNPFTWMMVSIFHIDILIRTAALLVIETFLALYDSIRGTLVGEKWWMELQFIFARVFVCILLREIVIMGAKIDIARGLPIIHVNLFGYDEQSHRRGPSSDFAHWSLRGIDDSIRRLWVEVQRSERRDYDLWIYSDHGQEKTLPYPIEFGRRINEVVSEIFGEVVTSHHSKDKFSMERNFCCQGRFSENLFRRHRILPAPAEETAPRVKVTGMGPLAHVYFLAEISQEEKERLIKELLETAEVPLILIRGKAGEAEARILGETYMLPRDAAQILGKEHPFLNELAMDIVDVVHHPLAGDLIISGWRSGQRPRTFPMENGSHAGFTPEETNGFALIPADAPLPVRTRSYIRPLDVREAAFRLLERLPMGTTFEWQPPAVAKTFRIMTYNVHGCVGMDGKLSPTRIARVIARHDLDAVALQELDVKRPRSGGIDQAEMIAQKLRMSYHFHPSFQIKDGKYGNAILSRYPMRAVRTGVLPKLDSRRAFIEPRGALWVEIDVGGIKINLINCHLSIWPDERKLQTEALLGAEWAGSELCREPVILCGDFNASPRSVVCKRIACKLRDAQTVLASHRPYSTWISGFPFSRIDHIFVSPQVGVASITVPRTQLDQAASDHAPLIAELQILTPDVTGKEPTLNNLKLTKGESQ